MLNSELRYAQPKKAYFLYYRHSSRDEQEFKEFFFLGIAIPSKTIALTPWKAAMAFCLPTWETDF